MSRIFAVLLLLLATTARGQPNIGSCVGPTIMQAGVVVGCGDLIDLAAAGFLIQQVGNKTIVNLPASVSLLGSCIGPASTFCATVDFTGKSVTLPAVVGTVGVSTAPSSGIGVKSNFTGTATGTVTSFAAFPDGITLGASGAFQGLANVGSYSVTGNLGGFISGTAYSFQPTISFSGGGSLTSNPIEALVLGPTIRSSSTNAVFSDFVGFPSYAGVVSTPAFKVQAGTPTNTLQTVDGLYVGGTFDFASACVGSGNPVACCTGSGTGCGWTGTTYKGVDIVDLLGTNTSPFTTMIGVDIATLTKGATKIGIRNASSTVNTPSTAQTISAASNTILCNATVVQVSNTTGASITLTSNPTIADGVNGQFCTIVNVSASGAVRDVVLTNGNNLKLPAAGNLTLGVNDVVTLMFNTTIADWVAVSASNN